MKVEADLVEAYWYEDPNDTDDGVWLGTTKQNPADYGKLTYILKVTAINHTDYLMIDESTPNIGDSVYCNGIGWVQIAEVKKVGDGE